MIIQISDLGKTYKTGSIEVEALKQANISISKGEFVSIMGPSGSGKSTLMNILGCLDRSTVGEYLLDGVNISSLDDKELARIRNLKIGFVFQAFNLLPRISALQNVELPMIYAGLNKKERRQRATEAMDKVGLTARMHHKPNELSGGQKQRVAIARALVNTPAIILADEPTGNLDSYSGEEIMTIFQDLNQEGVTIIVVTHEPEITEHTKRVISFKDGFLTKDILIPNPISAREVLNSRRSESAG